MECVEEFVCGSGVRVWKVVGPKADGITDDDGAGFSCEDPVATVVL